MNKMIIANLVYRPIRSIISVIAVGVEVTLILLIVGLALGMLNDNKGRQKGIGADIMVRPPNSGNMVTFNTAPVSVQVGDIIRKQPHISVVAPVVTQMNTNTLEVIYGIDLKDWEALGGPIHYLEGGPFKGEYDTIVDDYFAAANHVHPGSTVHMLNHDFRVSGVVPPGRGARRYIPIATMQYLNGSIDKASMFYVKLDDPNNADAAADQLKTVLKDYNILTIGQWLQLMSTDKIPGLSIFLRIVIGISVIIGFIVIFQSMYTAVMERTREIGILKSLGASKSYIVRVILRETLLLAIGGIIFGIVVSVVARAGIGVKWPTLPVQMTWAWVAYATLIAIGGAMLGAIYPAFKAAQKDPIDALAYE